MCRACPLSHNADFLCSHVYSDKFHVWAICPITELSAGSSHSCSQHTVTSAWAVVFACVRFICVWHHISQPHLRVGLNALQLLVLLKALISALTSSGEQVNKQIVLKKALSLNAHTHAYTDTAVWAHLFPWRSELIPAWSHKPHAYFKLKSASPLPTTLSVYQLWPFLHPPPHLACFCFHLTVSLFTS